MVGEPADLGADGENPINFLKDNATDVIGRLAWVGSKATH